MRLLYVDCCISIHARSRTKLLADTFLNAWKNQHPDWSIETVDLKVHPLLPLEEGTLAEREQAAEEGRMDAPCLALARQFAQSDRIVMAAPFWEMSFPSMLRVYIEHISVRGVTFLYTPQGPSGICRAKKMLYLTTAGGSLEHINFGNAYLRQLCQFYGIGEYHFIGADRQDILEVDHEIFLHEALKKAEKLAQTF